MPHPAPSNKMEPAQLKAQSGRLVWIDFLRVIGIFLIIVFHATCGAKDMKQHAFNCAVVVPALFFFLFFLGYFTSWANSQKIMQRWKWVFISYMLWGLISAALGRWDYFFGIRHCEQLLEIKTWWNIFYKFMMQGKPSMDNWSFWFLRAMLAFYSVLGSIILLRDHGCKSIKGILGALCLTALPIMLATPFKATWESCSFYIPLLGMLLRERCDLDTLARWIMRLGIPALIAHVVVSYVLVTTDRNLWRFVIWTIPGFLAFCAAGIGFTRLFPRIARWVAQAAPAVFIIFIGHMMLIINPLWNLRRIDHLHACGLALAALVGLYIMACGLNYCCPLLLQALNCGNLIFKRRPQA